MLGKVLEIPTEREIGYIGGEDGYRYKFESRDYPKDVHLKKGSLVSFLPDRRGVWATSVQLETRRGADNRGKNSSHEKQTSVDVSASENRKDDNTARIPDETDSSGSSKSAPNGCLSFLIAVVVVYLVSAFLFRFVILNTVGRNACGNIPTAVCDCIYENAKDAYPLITFWPQVILGANKEQTRRQILLASEQCHRK